MGVMAIRGAFKESLVPIESEKYDNKVTKKFLIVTLCGVVIGILVGAWSGFDNYEGKIGKAFLGLFYVIPTTAMVHYLERFENFKHLMSPKAFLELSGDEEHGDREIVAANVIEDIDVEQEQLLD